MPLRMKTQCLVYSSPARNNPPLRGCDHEALGNPCSVRHSSCCPVCPHSPIAFCSWTHDDPGTFARWTKRRTLPQLETHHSCAAGGARGDRAVSGHGDDRASIGSGPERLQAKPQSLSGDRIELRCPRLARGSTFTVRAVREQGRRPCGGPCG